MYRDAKTALAFYALDTLDREVELEDESDLLADMEEEICETCGSLMVEDESEDFTLFCPRCEQRYR